MKVAVPQATVSWEAAHVAVEAAVRKAEALGVRINVAVADAGGNLVAFLRMPGAFPQSISIAIDKAYTAGGFGCPTGKWMDVCAGNEGMKLGFSAQPRLVVFGGGLPSVSVASWLAASVSRAPRRNRTASVRGRACSRSVPTTSSSDSLAPVCRAPVDQRMAAHGAIVRRLSAVETLGSTTVICSDKTGTLTRNEMTAVAVWLPDGRALDITGAGYAPEGAIRENGADVANTPALAALIEAAALCNDAQLVPPDNSDPRWRSLGDPTEAALITLALKGCVDLEALRKAQPRQADIPFDSATKMMATLHGHALHGRICLKGAPEALVQLCGSARSGENVVPLDAATRTAMDEAGRRFAERALRLIAVAEIPDAPREPEAGFEQFAGKGVLLGLIGEMDPPRDEVRSAVEECQKAGIRPVMVTGDHKATGLAVARTLGIARDSDRAVDGAELEQMPEQDLRADLDRISVFARVHPAQKLRIVGAFQSQGHVSQDRSFRSMATRTPGTCSAR